MDMHEVKAEIIVRMSNEDIEDLMVTALEGGIGYWACLDNTSETFILAPEDEPVAITASRILLQGGELRFIDEEDHDMEYFLRLRDLLKGVRMFLEDGNGYVENGKLDMTMVDSKCADMIVQYAIFNDVTFG